MTVSVAVKVCTTSVHAVLYKIGCAGDHKDTFGIMIFGNAYVLFVAGGGGAVTFIEETPMCVPFLSAMVHVKTKEVGVEAASCCCRCCTCCTVIEGDTELEAARAPLLVITPSTFEGM